MPKIIFRLTGSCQLVDATTDLSVNNQSAQITGQWHWQFENDTVGTTFVSGATKTQVTSQETKLLGIIRINMGDIDTSSSEEQSLFLSYKSAEITMEDNKLKIVIKGQFTGGVGRYTNAGGTLTLITVNHIITEGFGQLILTY